MRQLLVVAIALALVWFTLAFYAMSNYAAEFHGESPVRDPGLHAREERAYRINILSAGATIVLLLALRFAGDTSRALRNSKNPQDAH